MNNFENSLQYANTFEDFLSGLKIGELVIASQLKEFESLINDFEELVSITLLEKQINHITIKQGKITGGKATIELPSIPWNLNLFKCLCTYKNKNQEIKIFT